jgi:hypothetical protein
MKAISLLLIAALVSVPLPAKSQTQPFCYMQISTGKVINLEQLCRSSNSTVNLNPDQIFQQMLLKEATPDDQQFLQSQGGMEDAIVKAKEFCSGYNQKLTKEQVFQSLAQESFIGGSSPKLNSFLSLINTVGTRVSCPSFSTIAQG